MYILKTALNKVYDITGAAIASVDGALRIWFKEGTVSNLVTTFTNPEETELLTKVFDGVETQFEGFVMFRGIEISRTGEIMVTLARGD